MSLARRSTLGVATIVLSGMTLRSGARRYAATRRSRRDLAADLALSQVEAAEVELPTGRAFSLHAWWVPAHPGAPAIVVQHGFASQARDMLPLAPVLHAAGFHALFVDGRGSGASPHDGTRVTPPMLGQDVEAAIDWVTAQDGVGGVGLLGHSMGGGAVITAASRRAEVGAVVTVAAVADPTLASVGFWPAWMTRRMLPVFRRRAERDGEGSEFVGSSAPRFPLQHAADLAAPLLVIHGAADRFVPVAHAHALHGAATGALLDLVPGARHASLEAFGPAVERALSFLHMHLDAPGSAVTPSG